MQALTVRDQDMIHRLALALALTLRPRPRADDSFTKGLSPGGLRGGGPRQADARGARAAGRARARPADGRRQEGHGGDGQGRLGVRARAGAGGGQEGGAEAASPGVIDRMKVILKPGTEIEYTTLDSMLVPPFDGWRKGTLSR